MTTVQQQVGISCPGCGVQQQVERQAKQFWCTSCGMRVIFRHCPEDVTKVFPVLAEWKAWSHPGCATSPHPVALVAQPKKRAAGSARWQIITGVCVLAAGLIATCVSYGLASPGGVYTAWWGAMLVGLYYIVRGIFSMTKNRRSAS
jgi:predicted RNA-binding Zn-ribbon protein involved in translation (DUF1610 family)